MSKKAAFLPPSSDAVSFVRFQVLTAASMKMSSRMLRRVVWQKYTDVSEVPAASIIRAVSFGQQSNVAQDTPWK
jgi:hypothetical protein